MTALRIDRARAKTSRPYGDSWTLLKMRKVNDCVNYRRLIAQGYEGGILMYSRSMSEHVAEQICYA